MAGTLGDVLLVAGAAWTLLATVGIFRFDDVYARMHALTKAATLGLLLMLVGSALHLGGADAPKLLLAGVFVFGTSPVSAHLISRAIIRTDPSRVRVTSTNEMPADEEPGSKKHS